MFIMKKLKPKDSNIDDGYENDSVGTCDEMSSTPVPLHCLGGVNLPNGTQKAVEHVSPRLQNRL